jgi:hypothetical protein
LVQTVPALSHNGDIGGFEGHLVFQDGGPAEFVKQDHNTAEQDDQDDYRLQENLSS